MKVASVLALALATVSLASLAQSPAPAASASPAGNKPEAMVMLVPVEVQSPAMQSGCWAQLYDDKNFKGEMLTVVGPMQLQALDKSTGRHLRRAIDSVVLGPKADLTVYEHRMFRDRSVNFGPNARESSVRRKLGSTGRVESLQLTCNS